MIAFTHRRRSDQIAVSTLNCVANLSSKIAWTLSTAFSVGASIKLGSTWEVREKTRLPRANGVGLRDSNLESISFLYPLFYPPVEKFRRYLRSREITPNRRFT